ncbi:discoidin domain-containing protein [Cohnella sp. GCM10012308]|uniref:discoidin domain-containing protein n=1 Tax=Cohnella sp. GCM10012308 TaxID=3317329 RepID=UPI00360C3E81
MRKVNLVSILAAFLTALMAFPASGFAVATGSASGGFDVFDPTGTGGFRYGPSIIINADDSIDMWTCSPGSGVNGREWDYIRYKRSTNGGLSWGTETIAIQPTIGGEDWNSNCDPGVVKFGGYYYLGYGSTLDSRGINNEVYVARSTSPGGPYEKWNGSGWGGNPTSFIKFTDAPFNTYGAGEPSFVVKDSTLYIYYTWDGRDALGRPTHQTRVRTAPIADPDWPGHTTYQGVALEKDLDGDDSTDHKYVDSLGKFIAVGSAKRFSNEGYVKLYESTDGITYKPATMNQSDRKPALHNAGVSGDPSGHFDTSKTNFIGYAYGTTWAFWYTAFQPFTLSNTNLPAVPVVRAVRAGNGQVMLHFRTTGVSGETYKIKYGTSSGSYTSTITGITSSPYTITGLANGTPYYFAIAASGASGDSADSLQTSALPLSYSAAPRASATASSSLAGWDVSNAIDTNINSTWASNGYTTSAHTEWMYVDTGGNRSIKRITATPRQGDYNGYPGFKIQVSLDASTWTDADLEKPVRIESPHLQFDYNLKTPIYGRYVRLVADNLASDGSTPDNYHFMLGDIQIDQVSLSASGSSNLSGWEPYRAIDGNSVSPWSSAGHGSPVATEWLALDTGDSNIITGAKLTPRANYNFPVDFKFQTSTNGTTWTDVPGASYTSYPNPGSDTKTFTFNSPVAARHLRLYATKLSADPYGNYYAQVGEFVVDYEPKRIVTASSSLTGWDAAKLGDSQNNTFWSGANHASANSAEWVQLDMGSVQNWSGLKVQPRPGLCFPVDFSIQYSTNGTAWSTVPGATYWHYYLTSPTEMQHFPFQSIVSARYFRINATKLATDGSAYYFQLGEVYAYK